MKSLPNINILPVHTTRLEYMGKEISFNPFTIQQEKGLLMALESNDNSDIIKNYQAVINDCIKDDINWNELTLVDFINLIVNLRAKSKGEKLSLKKEKCSKCNKPFEFYIELDESIKYKNKENKTDKIKFNENLTLELKPLNYNYLIDLDKQKDEIDLYRHTAAYAISKVIYNDDIFKITDYEKLKENVLNNLTLENLKDIFKKCENLISIQLEINSECPFCQNKEKSNVDNFIKLLG